MRFWIGLAMCAAPFVVLAFWMARESGWRVAAEVFGALAVLVAWISLGAALLTGELK